MPSWDFARVQNDVNPHILRMLEGTFSLDASPTNTTVTGIIIFISISIIIIAWPVES